MRHLARAAVAVARNKINWVWDGEWRAGLRDPKQRRTLHPRWPLCMAPRPARAPTRDPAAAPPSPSCALPAWVGYEAERVRFLQALTAGAVDAGATGARLNAIFYGGDR